MAAPNNTTANGAPLDIASQFNEEQYDDVYTSESDAPPAISTRAGRNPSNNQRKVTNVTVQKGTPRKQVRSNKVLKGAILGGSLLAAEDSSRRSRGADPLRQPKRGKVYFKALRNARRIIKDNRDLFNDGDELLVAKKPPITPSFPVIIVGLAILKDFLDVLDLSIIGIIFTTITSILVSLILAFWTFGRASGGWWKKRLIKWLIKRFIIMLGLELIPFFKIIPATTIFILMAHYREKKMVKIANLILEELHRAGFMKRIP
jgi:hypothetical protein